MTHETNELSAEEYQRQYDEAAAQLDAAAQPATTARDDNGQFAKVDTPAAVAEVVEPAKADPVVETPAANEPAKPAVTMEELAARLEKAEKMAKDNQAYATRMAQEAATLRRAQEAAQREASKPTILDDNPELADAIRYVANDPAPKQQAEQAQQQFQSVIEKAHPDAFATDMPKELQDAIASAWQGLGDDAQDPLNVVRVITQEKLAFNERLIGQRFAAEAARQSQKDAMKVPLPGASSGARAPEDAAAAEVKRIAQMSDADFAKEVRRVKGY